MTRFELKKVLGSLGGRIALVLLAAVVVLGCWMSVSEVEWVNEQGDVETGPAAISKLRNAQKQWAGILDTEKLEEIIRENQRICATAEAQSKDYKQNDIAYGWTLGIRPVLNMMNYAYSKDFQEYDWYCNEQVSPQQAGDFYTNRTKLMKQWLLDDTGSAYYLFNENERNYLLHQYESLETPFYVDYTEGWTQLMYYSPFVIMASALILGYLCAGIFSNEYRWKADSVYFSARHGRDRAVWAKIKAGFVMVTVLYWASVLIYSLVTLGLLGFDGWNCPLQIDLWKSFHRLTLWQAWVLTVVGGYIGNLFFAFFTMWVSAKTRSAVFASTVPFLLVFLPNFLDNLGSDTVSKILGLFPDQLLQVYQALRYFYVYDLGIGVFNAMELLLPLYGLLAAVLVPVMYCRFRKRAVK